MASSVTTGPNLLSTVSGVGFDSWDDFLDYLKARKSPSSLTKAMSGKAQSLLWGFPCPKDLVGGLSISDLAHVCDSPSEMNETLARECFQWAEKLEKRDIDSAEWPILVAVAGLADKLASYSDRETWSMLLIGLESCSRRMLDGGNTIEMLIGNEAMLSLGTCLGDVEYFCKFQRSAFEQLQDHLQSELDSDGAVQASQMKWIPTILASWVRCTKRLRAAEFELDSASLEQFEWFLRFAMRMMRGDGTTMLSDLAIPYQLDLFKTALKISEDKNDKTIARLILPGGNPNGKKTKLLNEQGTYSEWAGVGVLQQDWLPTSPRIAVLAQDFQFEAEVCCGEPMLRLVGMPSVSINGKELEATSEWDEVCCFFDDDICYLELEVELQQGVRLQRQLFLVHQDHLFGIADSVFCETVERIDYQLRVQPVNDWLTMHESETTEIYLRKREIGCLLMPAGVSEWQSSRSDDSFVTNENTITLGHSSLGKTLYSPLFVQLDPNKSVLPRTWRKLTVAESLEILPDDDARAYRLRIGEEQYVMYKSFSGAGNRTFLGQNMVCDMFFGRLLEDGNVEEILTLEP